VRLLSLACWKVLLLATLVVLPCVPAAAGQRTPANRCKLLAPVCNLQEDITAVSKSADAIKKRLAELDRSNEQVRPGTSGLNGGALGAVDIVASAAYGMLVQRSL